MKKVVVWLPLIGAIIIGGCTILSRYLPTSTYHEGSPSLELDSAEHVSSHHKYDERKASPTQNSIKVVNPQAEELVIGKKFSTQVSGENVTVYNIEELNGNIVE